MKIVDNNEGPRRDPEPGESEVEKIAHKMVHVFSLPALPVKQRFSILLNRMCSQLDMDYGYITLPQEPVSAVPFFSARMVVRPPLPGKPTLGHLISRSRQHMHFDSPAGAPDGAYIDQTGHMPFRFIGAPIVFDGRVYGTVEFGSAKGRNTAISSEHVMLVRILSGLAAGSLVLLSD